MKLHLVVFVLFLSIQASLTYILPRPAIATQGISKPVSFFLLEEKRKKQGYSKRVKKGKKSSADKVGNDALFQDKHSESASKRTYDLSKKAKQKKGSSGSTAVPYDAPSITIPIVAKSDKTEDTKVKVPVVNTRFYGLSKKAKQKKGSSGSTAVPYSAPKMTSISEESSTKNIEVVTSSSTTVIENSQIQPVKDTEVVTSSSTTVIENSQIQPVKDTEVVTSSSTTVIENSQIQPVKDAEVGNVGLAVVAQDAIMSFVETFASIIEVSIETIKNEETMSESKKSVEIAVAALNNVGEGLVDFANAWENAWSTGVGDLSDVEYSDEYMVKLTRGFKSLSSSKEIKQARNSILENSSTSGTELFKSAEVIVSELIRGLKDSHRFNKSLVNFKGSFGAFLSETIQSIDTKALLALPQKILDKK